MADPNDLVPLATFKTDYNITTTGDDTFLGRLITRASYDFYRFASRGPFDQSQASVNEFLAVQTFTENYSGHNTRQLKLRRYPVVSVTSLVVSQTIVPASPDGVQYGYTFDEDQIELVGSLFYAGINPRGYFIDGYNNIQVVYTAGYPAIPQDLQGAIEELVYVWYNRRKRPDVESESLDGHSTMRYRNKRYPAAVEALFEQYRRKFMWP